MKKYSLKGTDLYLAEVNKSVLFIKFPDVINPFRN